MSRRFLLRSLITLLGSGLIILFFMEMGCRYWFVFNPNHQASYAIQAYFSKLALADRLAAKEPTIILLGDSHMDFAGYAELLRARLAQIPAEQTQQKPISPIKNHSGIQNLIANYQVINLASPSVTPDLSIRILERARRSGAKIPLIILNINTRHFNRLALENPKATIEDNLNHTYEGQCLLNSPVGFADKTACFFQRHFYLLRYQNALKTQLSRFPDVLLKPDAIQAGVKPAIYPAREVSPMGWAPGYPVFNSHEKTPEAQPGAPRKMIWDEAAMDRFLAYCRLARIQPVLVILPVHPRYRNQMPMPPDAFRERVAQYSASHHVVFWNFMDLFQPSPQVPLSEIDLYFTDRDHVSAQGAIKTTEALADSLLPLLKKSPMPTKMGRLSP